MIDAQHRAEERYSKLSLAYETKQEEQTVTSIVNNTIKQYKIEPNIYTCTLGGTKQVLVLEYHDDYDRESGTIFDSILKQLSITAS